MTILATLNQDQFVNAFGKEDVVANLSKEAIAQCLEAVNKLQVNQSQVFDWRELFKDAVEIDSQELIERHKDILIHYDDHLISLASTIVFNNNIDKMIDSNIDESTGEMISNHMIIKNNINEMLKNNDFLEGAATIVARDNWYHSLDNGKWFKLA